MAESLSSKPSSSIPYSTLTSWIGAATLLDPVVAGLILSRPCDATALYTAGNPSDSTLPLPLLIIYGTNDSQVMGENVAQEAGIKAFRDLTVTVIEGAGHAVFFDAFDACVEAMLEFTGRVLE